MAKAKPASGGRITRDDLERRFAAVQDGLHRRVESRKSAILTASAVGLIVLLMIVFLLGKRSGKRKTTLVEIRRA